MPRFQLPFHGLFRRNYDPGRPAISGHNEHVALSDESGDPPKASASLAHRDNGHQLRCPWITAAIVP